MSVKSGSSATTAVIASSEDESLAGSSLSSARRKRPAAAAAAKGKKKLLDEDIIDLATTDESESEDDSKRAKTQKKAKQKEDSDSSDDDAPDGQYEVEEVLDYVNEENGVGEMYYVKWKNWDADFNTWEPPGSMINCEPALLVFYYKRKAEVEKQIAAQVFVELPNGKRRRKGPAPWKIPPDPRPIENRLEEFYKATKPLDEKLVLKTYDAWNRSRVANKGKDLSTRWNISKLNKYIQDGTDGNLSEKQMEELRKELYYIEIEMRKTNLNGILKEWQVRINSVTKGKPHVTVENEVDFEGPPKDFEFVNSYIPAAGVTIPNDPPVGCSCEDNCYENRKNCCGELSGGRFAYTRHGKVGVPIGTPIFECNSKCACGPECTNRIVQDGESDAKLCIFRTNNGCGWGVKAMKAIKRGTFVCLYVGEVIQAEEAERRGKEKVDGHTYLFDLDFNDQENPMYTVDASKLGNVAHFINHSCDPNLGVYAVWVDCLDPNLPKLAMFAISDIAKGEELALDYNQADSDATSDDNVEVSPSKGKRQKCLCGSDQCRKFLFA